MMTFITVIHITTVVLLVITVLLQSGKGAEISASFGGSSQTVFGSSGGQNFFQKLTYTLAAIFMLTSLTLTVMPGKVKRSVFEGYSAPASSTVPGGLPAGGTAPQKGNPNSLPVGGDAPAANKGAPVAGVAQVPGSKANVPAKTNEPVKGSATDQKK